MAEADELVRARVVISGRVQGVWFRGTACEQARALELSGWVRNRPDGKVEAVFEGPRRKVAQAVSWCHRGPPLAQVTGVELEWQEPRGECSGFSVKY